MSMFDKLFGKSEAPEPAPKNEDIQQGQLVNPSENLTNPNDLENKPDIPLDIVQQAQEITQNQDIQAHDQLNTHEQNQEQAPSPTLNADHSENLRHSQQQDKEQSDFEQTIQEARELMGKNTLATNEQQQVKTHEETNILAETARSQEWEVAQNKISDMEKLPDGQLGEILRRAKEQESREVHHEKDDKGMDMDM